MNILHATTFSHKDLPLSLYAMRFCFVFFYHLAFLFQSLHTPLQTKLLTQYILNLGKYDQNYDIRDRTRFIRQLIVPNEKSGALNKYARRILLAPKPAPVLESTFKGTSCICDINHYPHFETY